MRNPIFSGENAVPPSNSGMKRNFILAAGLVLLAYAAPARFMRPDVEKVPVDRLIANLEQKANDNPREVQPVYALARVHAIAFAQRKAEFEVQRKDGLPFFGFQDRGFLPRGKVTAADAAASNHLAKAIEHYGRALAVQEDHAPSLVGLGWCQEQAGKKKEAVQTYRKALQQAYAKENKSGHIFGSSVTAEVADYLLPLLDPVADAEEIKRVEEMKTAINRLPRAVTPLLVPLADGLAFEELVDRQAAVEFDLDGSGRRQKWNWLTPNAAWLVYDPDSRGEVRSGLDLFGAVTFWVFWDNGYEALAAMDDDQDGWLRGAELAGLALWRDANSNGRSEPGETRPLSHYGITALNCRFQTHATGIPYSPAGAALANGQVRPTYDWISSAAP